MFRGTPNTSGRPKGSANKTTSKVREAFIQLVENNLEKMHNDLDCLEPKDRLKFILDLASFIIPKLKAVEMTADIQTNNEDLLARLMAIPEDHYNKLYKDE